MQGYFIIIHVVFYLAVNRFHSTQSPTKPANPAEPRPLITPITLSITEIPIIAPPPNKISVATPRPKTVMISPVNPLKNPLKYLNTLSIIKNNLVNTDVKIRI